jgi:glycosyltransferase involved in cell wall biosynthesis
MWTRWTRRFLRDTGADLVHVHDLPVAEAVARAAEPASVPVVLDFHENFPAAIRGWGFDRGLKRFFYPEDRWAAYERAASRRAAGVIVVVPESRARIEGYGLDPDRVVVVSNTDSPSYGEHVDAVDAGAMPVTFLYIGGFGPHRGLETVIDAVGELEDDAPARVRIVGDGRIRGRLEERARATRRTHQITIEPWVPQPRVPDEIGSCHVGLVPHVRNEHTNTTIPHKLFLYMAMGRPVLVSDCAPLKRVVEETGAGLVFAAGDASSCADAMRALLDPDLRRRLGEAGKRAVRERYNWKSDGEALCRFHERILAR